MLQTLTKDYSDHFCLKPVPFFYEIFTTGFMCKILELFKICEIWKCREISVFNTIIKKYKIQKCSISVLDIYWKPPLPEVSDTVELTDQER